MRALQVIMFVAVCAAANAGYHSQPGNNGYYPGYRGYSSSSGYNAYPKYSYDYSVSDPHTGDYKTQWESRDGDVVKGAYSLAEADGTTRLVEYTADKINGFQAVVKRIGHAQHSPQLRYNNPYSQSGYYPYH